MFPDLSPLWISLRAAILATGITFVLGILTARWMMTYHGKCRALLDGLLTLPLVLPPTVVGFLLLLLLGRNSPMGQLLNHVGISIIFTWYATVIAATVVAFPLMYKTALGAFQQIEPNLLNCARTLGASEWRIFWQVLLPLAWPGLIAGSILSFARALGEFGATLMVAGSIPKVTQTIPLAIFFAAEAGDMVQALGWVLLMVAVSLSVIGVINNRAEPQTHQVRQPPSRQKQSQRNSLSRQILNVLILGQRYADWDLTPVSSDAKPEMHTPSVALPIRHPSDSVTIAAVSETVPSNHRAVDATGNRSASQPSRSLRVNIRKRLQGFQLHAHFDSEGIPLGILGSSGSGKSMTLRCIAGLDTPTDGQIILNDRVLFDSQQHINVPSRERRIGVVFQNYALFPHLNVAQNIAFGLQDLSTAERSHRIQSYLHLMHLDNLAHRYPHQLSGGQQQRVALARALAIAPDAILLDEPLSALDTHLRSQLEQLLANVLSTFDGISLFVTHNLDEVYRVCPQIMVMDEGRAIATGPTQQIFERPHHPRVAQITGCENITSVAMREPNLVAAKEWGCILETLESVPDDLTQVGIRAHQITVVDVHRFESRKNQGLHQPNSFPCWLASQSETPHRITLYLKVHGRPDSVNDYHLQAEITKEQWSALKSTPFPWQVQLDPTHLILMSDVSETHCHRQSTADKLRKGQLKRPANSIGN